MSPKLKASLVIVLVHLSLWAMWAVVPEDGLEFSKGISIHFKAPWQYQHDSARVDFDSLSQTASLSHKQNGEGWNLPKKLRIQKADGPHPLIAFFRSLKRLEEKRQQQVRIIHYGDSQIEDDRLSSTLRLAFQNEFGGCGVGLIPIADTRGRRYALEIIPSNNWHRYLAYSNEKESYPDNEYGLAMCSYRFGKEWGSQLGAGVSILKNIASEYAYKDFSHIGLIYRSKDTSVAFESSMSGIPVDSNTFPKSAIPAFGRIKAADSGMVHRVSIAGQGAEILGLSLECDSGILLDNLALRGSSGFEFSSVPSDYLAEQLSLLNTCLIIYQFGTNQTENNRSDYGFYRDQLSKQLLAIKKANPQGSILVLGLSDRSIKKGGEYITNPNVLKIREIQKDVALELDCAFWDMFDAMGGEGSMPEWVANKPPLATKDYTHFTFAGAKLIGRLLYKAILLDYKQWERGYVKPSPPNG